MDIKNAICRLSELTSEQIDSLRNAMPKGKYDFFPTESMIGVTPSGAWGTWDVAAKNRNIISYTEMMQLLGKTMKEFTKSDLKTGMFVKFRRGDYRVVLGDYALDTVSRCCLLNIKDNLLAAHDAFDGIDIMAVYRIGIPASLSDHLKGNDLLLIWERTEQTPAQKEMEVLQAKMDELQEQMKVVQAKL